MVRLADTDRSTTGLGAILIPTPTGMIPLRLVADLEETDGPNQIQRENTRRRVAVFANTASGFDMSATVAAIRAEIAQVSLPPGYTLSLEGTFEAQEQAARLIGVLSLVSLSLIFLILATRYRSAVLALIIMGIIPMALIGSVMALAIANQPLSVASMVGFITLAGISSRNGILKISHAINLAIDEKIPFGPDLVIRASLERLSPVLMTALAAGFALLPLLWSPDAAGREILHPVAVTIFGGLVSATLLDLVLTPLILLKLGRNSLEHLVAVSNSGNGLRPAQAY